MSRHFLHNTKLVTGLALSALLTSTLCISPATAQETAGIASQQEAGTASSSVYADMVGYYYPGFPQSNLHYLLPDDQWDVSFYKVGDPSFGSTEIKVPGEGTWSYTKQWIRSGEVAGMFIDFIFTPDASFKGEAPSPISVFHYQKTAQGIEQKGNVFEVSLVNAEGRKQTVVEPFTLNRLSNLSDTYSVDPMTSVDLRDYFGQTDKVYQYAFAGVAAQPAGASLSADRTALKVPGEGTWLLKAPAYDPWQTELQRAVFVPEAGFTENPSPISVIPTQYENGQAKEQLAAQKVQLRLADNKTPPSYLTYQQTASRNFYDPQRPVVAFESGDLPYGKGTMTFAVPENGGWFVSTDGKVAGDNFLSSGKLTNGLTGLWQIHQDNSVTFTSAYSSTPGYSSVGVFVTGKINGKDAPVQRIFLKTHASGVALLKANSVARKYLPGQGTLVALDKWPNTSINVDKGSNLFDYDSAHFVVEGQPAGAQLSPDGKKLTVPNEGTWTLIDEAQAYFSPVAGFTGAPQPVYYSGTWNQQEQPAGKITLTPYKETLKSFSATGSQGEPVTVRTSLTPADAAYGLFGDPKNNQRIVHDFGFYSDNQPAGAQLTASGRTLVVPGEGSWTIAPVDARKTDLLEADITFTPEPGFTGKASTVYYGVLDTPLYSAAVNVSVAPAVLDFKDVPANYQFFKEIKWLAGQKITTGYADNTFRPRESVNRDAIAAFFYRMAGSPAYTPPKVSPFKDVPTDYQFYKEIAWMAEQGITTGYPDGTFRPHSSANRDAIAAFMYRFAGKPSFVAPQKSAFKDVAQSRQFYQEISWLASTGITTGYADGSYQPDRAVNRDAMAAFLYRYSAKGFSK